MDRAEDAYSKMMNAWWDDNVLHDKQVQVAKDELNAMQQAVTALSKQKADLEARVSVAEQKAIEQAVRAREAELRAGSAAESAATMVAKHAVRAREAEMKHEAVQRQLEAVRDYQIASGYGMTPDTNRRTSGIEKANAVNGIVSSREALSGEVCSLYHPNVVGGHQFLWKEFLSFRAFGRANGRVLV